MLNSYKDVCPFYIAIDAAYVAYLNLLSMNKTTAFVLWFYADYESMLIIFWMVYNAF